MPFKNPIIPGFYPDPSICRVGQDYYIVNSTFEWFPSVPVHHSRDLEDWTLVGHILTGAMIGLCAQDLGGTKRHADFDFLDFTPVE